MNTRLKLHKVVPALLFAFTFLFSLLAPQAVFAQSNVAGGVFVLSNATAGNAVIAFNRDTSGKLTPAGTYATGGLGSGAGLGSQGAIAINADRTFLFAVNAGSNDVSVFRYTGTSLTLVDREASGGALPVSLTSYGDLLYVLNEGGSGNIQRQYPGLPRGG